MADAHAHPEDDSACERPEGQEGGVRSARAGGTRRRGGAGLFSGHWRRGPAGEGQEARSLDGGRGDAGKCLRQLLRQRGGVQWRARGSDGPRWDGVMER